MREAAEHYVQLATELFAVYRAMGFEPADFYAPFSRFRDFDRETFDESVEQAMALGRDMRSRNFIGRPSLHDDLLRGRSTELDSCVDASLAEAGKHGIEVPTVRAAYRIVKSLEFWLERTGGVTVEPLPALAEDPDRRSAAPTGAEAGPGGASTEHGEVANGPRPISSTPCAPRWAGAAGRCRRSTLPTSARTCCARWSSATTSTRSP